MYDLIGDIHGHADELKALLHKMDYRQAQGCWRHPQRQVVFLGDFVDRGPQQVETVAIARAMVEQGQALAVMGNHEFNAVAWATPHTQRPGEYLRPHNAKNRSQHRAYLEQVGEGSSLHREHIAWFKTLPLYLKLPELRVVHACWHLQHMAVLAPWLDEQGGILPDAWVTLTTPGTAAFVAVETLLKGLELELPEGRLFHDKDNHPRRHIRTRWWSRQARTYRDLALVPAEMTERIPHDPVPVGILPGYDGQKPLFVGHYWLNGTPAPLTEHIACLDYSVAAKHGGKLCAYRWQGEHRLLAAHFCWVER